MKFENANEMNLENMVLLGDRSQFRMLGYNSQVTQFFYCCYFKYEHDTINC